MPGADTAGTNMIPGTGSRNTAGASDGVSTAREGVDEQSAVGGDSQQLGGVWSKCQAADSRGVSLDGLLQIHTARMEEQNRHLGRPMHPVRMSGFQCLRLR